MTSNNYVTILGWMTNLELKGNELIVYAIIHGFSQDKDSYFYGSIEYLSEWTGTSKQCVQYTLNNLVERGLLSKISRDGRTSLYRTINPFEDKTEIKEKNPIKEESVNKKDNVDCVTILSYLNQKTNSRFRLVSSTEKLINQRLKEGYTIEDFFAVIDVKCKEWLDSAEWSKYLRPSTLFGNKFDTYLNQKKEIKSSTYSLSKETVVKPSYENVNLEKVY